MENNIIIVDDHQIIIDGLISMLEETSFNLKFQTCKGQEVLDYLKNNNKDIQLVLTDVSMPNIGGIEICTIIKCNYPHIKVLILSMYDNIAIVKDAINAEADGYILKNSGKEELLTAMTKIIDGGTYFAQDIIPLLYGSYIKEIKQTTELALLSEREIEILKLIVQEHTSDEIAAKLFISKKTVDNHRAHLLEKTGCKTTIGLVKFALRNQLEK
jgi:two-component system, NarL family, nitrate/nitrite response regulator NarL